MLGRFHDRPVRDEIVGYCVHRMWFLYRSFSTSTMGSLANSGSLDATNDGAWASMVIVAPEERVELSQSLGLSRERMGMANGSWSR